MTTLSEPYLKTGGDPRTLTDYAALRDELGKLSHPARPDVNWQHVEKLSLALFEHNGVELQTAAWYTLARAQLAGLAGLNEGLAILEALIRHQWGNLWPPRVHARVEILSALSRRVQQWMRKLPASYSDLSQLYLAEQQLKRLNEVLQRLELRNLSQFDALAALMHTSAVRLENSDAATGDNPVSAPAVALPAAAQSVAEMVPGAARWIYVAQPTSNFEVTTAPPKTRRWQPFVAGMLTMLVAGCMGQWAWYSLHRTDPLVAQLKASLTPLPLPLSRAQINSLKQDGALSQNVLRDTQQQLAHISGLAPDWSLNYGQQLIDLALAASPEEARGIATEWQQQVKAAALPEEAMGGWQQGMEQLQQLTLKLNALDGQRGKYMTVSELKSVVYNATQAFNRSVPAEEQLRLYSLSQSDIQRRQAERALAQLQARYFLLKQEAEKARGDK
ncbi:type VI secretion system protein VasL [Erwinia persicina]|uniref:VasL domain-containing protein n=1 Tax=Erwinia persicina TaxID=55211 RepID=UPI0020A1A11B|nr:VasL domain-containing protein [Erwinia persicina]MCP1439720.1 type VI secretion system protein VasL [Erwinia persicina]